MTQPFPTYRGASYRLSMRCSQRQMLLLPSDIVNLTVGYWLGVTSLRFGILVHAVCVMSNHIHLDVTDRFAERGAALVPHRQLRDLVIEVDKTFHDNLAFTGAPAPLEAIQLRNLPTERVLILSTAVITSPRLSPATAAGLPGCTSAMSTPLLTLSCIARANSSVNV